MATNPQEIQLTEEQKQALAELADETGRAWPVVFAEALRTYRAGEEEVPDDTYNESAYDALKRVGLIGCIEGGPSDLSTNGVHGRVRRQ